MSSTRRAAAAAGLVLALVGLPLATARACLWDRDTLAGEARGLPDVVRILTGRFERFPPKYYEMRLDRVATEVASHPENLALYDDAAVACDRLGRGADAITWMAKKRAVLDTRDAHDPHVRDHLYRYHANLGTFLAHKWIRDGADRDRLDEIQEARGEIAAAIALNPDAHFGREKYQLLVLDWLLTMPEKAGEPATLLAPALKGISIESALDNPDGKAALPVEVADAVRGLSGLVVLGDAWESIDVFQALSLALLLDGARSSVAYLARLRCEELIDAGRRSLDPSLPTGAALKATLFNPPLMEDDQEALRRIYRTLRDEADAWHDARTAFLTRRLNAGRHPDTDADFWNGYQEANPPSLASLERRFEGRKALSQRLGLPREVAEGIAVAMILLSAFAALAALGIGLHRRRRTHRARPSGFDPEGLPLAGNDVNDLQ